MKYLFSILLAFCFNSYLKAQTLIVRDSSVVYGEIKKFYFEGRKDTLNFPMPLVTQWNIIDSSQTQYGVFKFQIHSSNALPGLYLRDFGSNKVYIIRHYDLEFIFLTLLNYFKVNDLMITYFQKLHCISKIIELLKQRESASGSILK